jgi:DNA-binding CsgD family transcriptional regulator
VIADQIVPEALDAYLQHTARVLTREMMDLDRDLLLAEGAVQDLASIWPGFYDTELYNLVWRPYDHHYVLQGLVCRRGRPAGLIHLARDRRARAFDRAERDTLVRLLPYVEHGLSADPGQGVALAAAGDSALLAMDRAGRLRFASDQARGLLLMARYPSYPLPGSPGLSDLPVPAGLVRLCRDLDAIFRGREAAPPTVVHVNARGRFVFRAHWMDPAGPGAEGLIGVTVEHAEPLAARLLRGTRDLPLTPAQREVCLLLAQGRAQEEIAGALGVKQSTVKDHVRKLYDRLGVRRREDLAGLLSGLAGPATRPQLVSSQPKQIR